MRTRPPTNLAPGKSTLRFQARRQALPFALDFPYTGVCSNTALELRLGRNGFALFCSFRQVESRRTFCRYTLFLRAQRSRDSQARYATLEPQRVSTPLRA